MRGVVESWPDGKPRQQWDDVQTTFTSWDETGAVLEHRLYTPAELDAAVERSVTAQTTAVTAADLSGKMAVALAANFAFLAIASPTAAQVRDQTRLLTRQMNAAIRYVTGRLDSTDGT